MARRHGLAWGKWESGKMVLSQSEHQTPYEPGGCKAYKFSFAETIQDLQIVASLRYAIFSEEMSSDTHGQCMQTGTISDALDFIPQSKVLIARDSEGACCGTMRTTNLPFAKYPAFLLPPSQMDLVRSAEGDGSEYTFVTRLAVAAPYRKSLLSFELIRLMVAARVETSRYALFSVGPEFERMYEKLGGDILSRGYVNSFGIPRILVRIPLQDLEHHRRRNSMLKRVIEVSIAQLRDKAC